MQLGRARRRSSIYMKDQCRIVNPSNETDDYGYETENAERVLYDGRCFVSPGNMWSFETGVDAIRGGRSDIQVYIPVAVEDLSPDCIIEYDSHRYEVIGFGSRVTAGATINVTARRVS